ncbi:hypothetical protein TCAL_14366 [Tigriopus californicus]|uniref:Uncharacterized protein n=1 Tax=Tigriopus californicus TaxID=6832 RepID=A0A553NBK8_TIGCA|nr:hypothetical protein TCAL_14366 [Tigriopus californicus]
MTGPPIRILVNCIGLLWTLSEVSTSLVKRQASNGDESGLMSSTTDLPLSESEDDAKEGGSGGPGVSLGEILGLLFLVCCILYCIGIGYKIFKIVKGTYVEEEPVFMKYK